MSDDEATRNAEPAEKRNTDKVHWIMGNFVAGKSKF